VFTRDHYLFDQRGSPATVLLERMRVIGFDMGAGASCALGISGPGLVLLARDSRFEGGYGHSPEHGRLMSISQVVLARFERCVVDRIGLELNGGGSGTTVVFDQCALTDLTDSAPRFMPPEGKLEYEARLRASPGIVMNATSISFFDNAAWHLEKTDWKVPSRDLNELFPNWKQQLQR
ncbi:MAG TPA: hypothetical protein VM509_12805, partial [Planctomycetota bacterium]|nr:hypothetical protein [Planctomycetota bacterium]